MIDPCTLTNEQDFATRSISMTNELYTDSNPQVFEAAKHS